MPMAGYADTIDNEGQQPYEQCGYCHEYDGNPRMSAYPRIAGQQRNYLVKQLKEFRSGKRESPMQATAELLSDEDIQIVTHYFSQQRVRAPILSPQSLGERKRAETLFMQGDELREIPACRNCHGDDGLGNNEVPRLALQNEEYLKEQLMQFKQGQRSNDPDAVMRAIAGKLTSLEVEALVKYLSRMQ